jgi:hypothetical protein
MFTADGKLLVQSAETGETREATNADRTKVGRALRVPQPYWQWWLRGGETPSDG